jgi:asparagine synthase (glutamine-hydrolysing)
MANILPHEVQWRIGKANLSPNFEGRLLDYDRALMDEIILYDPSLIEEYVDVPALRRVYERYISQRTSKDALVVYGAITLALWLRKGNLAPSCVRRKEGTK